MMTDKEFIEAAYKALYSRTMYVNGAFGAPATAYNKVRYSNKRNAGRIHKIQNAPLGMYFFDCVCLVKSLLWGWRADPYDRNGGAVYASNGVPDVGEDVMIKMCTYSSTDFSDIVPGSVVWLPGHIGIYVGDGLVIEATAAWTSNVLMSCCGNVGRKSGYPVRTWTKWGKLPWVQYTQEEDMTEAETKKIAKQQAIETVKELFPELFDKAIEERESDIKDLPPSSEYEAEALEYMKEHGYMKGDGKGRMMAKKALTRGEYAMVEYNEAKADGRA